jgi:hypothetical protein
VLGLMAGAGASAGASTTPSAASSAASNSAASNTAASDSGAAASAARAAIENLQIGQHGNNHKTGVSKKVSGLTQVQSSNWSGYADTGSSFSKISSSWTEPSVSCSGNQEQLAAFWVGIDGYSSSSVEQDGTMIECYRGAAYHYTWWEMYPSNSVQVVGSTAAAGDSITATVTRSGTSYSLKVTDSTHTADSFTTTQSCSNCANSSAEWIAEAPSGSSGIYPLADFGTWSTSGASVTGGSGSGTISSFTDDEITMTDSSNKVMAQPGSLNSSGNAFSVAWKATS